MSVSTLRRPRSVVAGLAAAVVAAGLMVAGSAAPAAAAPDAAQSASETAQETGVPQPIPELTDSFSTFTALPDGTYQQDVSDVPQRIQRGSDWVDLDATLSRNSDGTLSPAASFGALSLSGGGTDTLAVLHSDQDALTLTWPTTLPEPTVSGRTATYPNVLDGVDLVVTAVETGGIEESLIVHTAEAAANPALGSLSIGTALSSGLTLSTDDGDNVSVTNSAGDVIFHSTAPTMWDSSTTSAPQAKAATSGTGDDSPDEQGPPPGAQIAPVDVSTSAGHITLTPDQDLLTGADTTYPVVIDPTWMPWTGSAAHSYTWVQQAYPNPSTSNWNSGHPAVGYQQWETTYGRNRAYYQFKPGTSISGSHIKSAYLKVTTVDDEAGLASCSLDHHMVAKSAGHISSSTTWNNQPSIYSTMDTKTVHTGYDSCANQTTSFTVTPSIAADGDGTLTYVLEASPEDDPDQYMRFSGSASLSITYNHIPKVPTNFAFSPAPQNPTTTTFSAPGWIGANSNVSIAAYFSDPDGADQNLTGEFHVWDKGGSGDATATDVVAWTDSAGHTAAVSGAGTTASIKVPTTKLQNGHLYGADARATDGIDTSDVTDYHYFWYDDAAPRNVSVASTDFPQPGQTPPDDNRKQVGEDGVFTLTGNDPLPTETGAKASGLDHYDYSTSSAADLAGDGGKQVAADANGTAQLTLPQTVWGINYLYVAGVDKAGNQSTTFTYRYYVPDDPTTAIHPGDVDNNGNPDLLATNTNGNLELYDTTPHDPETPTIASAGPDSPNGTSWADVLIAHRSSSDQSASANKVDDLWAHQQNDTELYVYVNNLNKDGLAANSGHYFTYNHAYPVFRPLTCADSDCTGYDTNDWTHVSQLVAPGDLDGDGYPDLLTVENGTLWLFPGDSATGVLGNPHRLGDTYANTRLVAPGDASGDGTPDLWSFDDDHTVNMYLVNVGTPKDPKSITITRKSDDDPNFDSTQRPLIASPGDVNGDGLPDVYTTAVVAGSDHQQLWANMGETIGDHSPDLTGHSVVDDTQAWENITHIS